MLVLGCVVLYKCVEDVIEVFVWVVVDGVDVMMMIVGSMLNYEYSKFFFKCVCMFDVLVCVDFMGMVDDVDLFFSYDCVLFLLLMSWYEGFCIFVFEVMYCGILVVVWVGYVVVEVVGDVGFVIGEFEMVDQVVG